MNKDYISFNGCAKEYILQGKSLAEMCDHNADVARKYGKSNVCFLWRFVKNQYAIAPSKIPSKTESRNSTTVNQNAIQNRLFKIQNTNTVTPGWGNGTDGHASDDSNSIDDDNKNLDQNPKQKVDNEKMVNGTSNVIRLPASVQLSQSPIMEVDLMNNFMYGGAELKINEMDLKALRNGFLYYGPHDITREYSLPEHSLMGHDLQTARTAQEMANENRRDLSPVF